MKRHVLVILAGLAAMGACKKKKDEPHFVEHGDDFFRPEQIVVVREMKTFDGDAGASDSPTESHALVGVPGGAVEIWTHRVVGRTEVLVRRLDAEGQPTNGTHVFDGLEGNVPWLTAVHSGKRVWIGWLVSSKAGKKALVGFVDDDGKEAALAYTVPVETDDDSTAAGSVRVAPRTVDGGHAVFGVVTAKKPAPCADASAGSACHSAVWSVFGYRSFENKQAALRTGTIQGGANVNIDALLDLGGAIFASASGWNDGPVVDFALAPPPGQDAGAVPLSVPAPVPPPRPPFSVAFNGDALVYRAASQPWGEKKGKCPRPSFEQGLCEQIAIVPVTKAGAVATVTDGGAGDAGDASAPSPLGWLPLTAVNETCADGVATIELVYPQGSIRLASKPGTHVPELQGWTGRALLALDENGHVTKRPCEGGKLGPAVPVGPK